MINVGEKIGSLKLIRREDLKEVIKERKNFFVISTIEYKDDITEEEIRSRGNQPDYEMDAFDNIDDAVKNLCDIFEEGFGGFEMIFVEEVYNFFMTFDTNKFYLN